MREIRAKSDVLSIMISLFTESQTARSGGAEPLTLPHAAQIETAWSKNSGHIVAAGLHPIQSTQAVSLVTTTGNDWNEHGSTEIFFSDGTHAPSYNART